MALPEITKDRYSIREAAEIAQVEPHVLRFWERQFPELKPRRTRSGTRFYSREDVATVLAIRGLLYDEGMTIEGAKKRLSSTKHDSSASERMAASSARQLVSLLLDELRELRKHLLEASFGRKPYV